MFSRVLLMFFLNCLFFKVIAQTDLQKVIPLSPNAASIAKYGETPVGYFTGVPNIGIPVYTIQSKELSLPLSLSYHAGGNKVEEIASWVGLGWSLGNIPIISRKINGLPDEGDGGYISNYKGFTVQQIPDNIQSLSTPWRQLQIDVFENKADLEADIFYFTLANKSGKFFWNQEAQKFITNPRTNIEITYNSGSFKIVDDDGSIYLFTTTEVTNPQTANSWLVDRMYNANKTDSLIFSYNYEIQSTNILNPLVKNIVGVCDRPSSMSSINNIGAYLVSSIQFNNGRVVFNKEQDPRLDLNGGHALNNIEVYNSRNELLKKVAFSYSYRQSLTDSYCSSYESKRLMLNSVTEKGGDNLQGQTYSFVYDSQIATPCRLSASQDYWGFYNGASNQDLIPTAYANLPTFGRIEVPGADRYVHPEFSQFAILKKIIYPTGGYSEFEYENNTAYNPDLPATYVRTSSYLFGEQQAPTTSTYEKTFRINTAPDKYLNSEAGGSFVDISIGDLGCDISSGAGPCAMLTLKGLEASNNQINTTITHNVNLYLPNGLYEMKAVFDQNPAQYDNFYYIISWQVPEHSAEINRYVGGLRIKSIKTSSDGRDALIKNYRYTSAVNSDTSSGEIFGRPFFIGYEDFFCINYITGGYTEGYNYRVASQSNYPAISHSGSFVGYNTVYEQIDANGDLGVTEYKFTHMKDIVSGNSPFPPAFSYEQFRGQPLEENVFKRQNGLLVPLKKTSYEYDYNTFTSSTSLSLKTRLLKEPAYVNGIMFESPVYSISYYENVPLLSNLSKKIEMLFSSDDATKVLTTTTDYFYDNSNFQLISTRTQDSKGATITNNLYYATNFLTSGDAELARQALVAQNRLTVLLKKEVLTNSNITQQILTDYKIFGSKTIPSQIFQKLGNGPLVSKVEFLNYDASSNLLEQRKTNDVKEIYFWGYGGRYPVAKIIGSDYATAQQYVSQNILDSPTNDQQLRDELNKLRQNLPNAFVATYTYKPLIGITSETDQNGRTTYYEYDGLGRLSIVRDLNGKVVKKVNYSYYNQP